MDKTPLSLLARLRQPSQQAAWGRFVELYTPILLSWCRQVGLHGHDAADLVQDVFVTLVEVLPRFEYDRHRGFRRWLRTILLNKWRDRCRHHARHPAGREEFLAEVPAPDELEPFWETEFRRVLAERALRLLQTDFQEKTWKAFWELTIVGRTAEQVAAELGITAGAVYAARFRVLTRLRQELAGMLE